MFRPADSNSSGIIRWQPLRPKTDSLSLLASFFAFSISSSQQQHNSFPMSAPRDANESAMELPLLPFAQCFRLPAGISTDFLLSDDIGSPRSPESFYGSSSGAVAAAAAELGYVWTPRAPPPWSLSASASADAAASHSANLETAPVHVVLPFSFSEQGHSPCVHSCCLKNRVFHNRGNLFKHIYRRHPLCSPSCSFHRSVSSFQFQFPFTLSLFSPCCSLPPPGANAHLRRVFVVLVVCMLLLLQVAVRLYLAETAKWHQTATVTACCSVCHCFFWCR